MHAVTDQIMSIRSSPAYAADRNAALPLSRQSRAFRFSTRGWVEFVILGYLVLTRSFAYIGFAPANIFISEIALGCLILFRSRALDWFFVNRSRDFAFKELRWGATIYLLHGGFAISWAIWLGYDLIDILRMAGFHYYVVYLPFGLWLGMQYPDLLVSLVKKLAWITAIYGTLYVLFLNRMSWITVPGAPWIQLFGQPGSGGIVMLGLLSLGLAQKMWPHLLAATFVFFGIQMRAEWLGGIAGCAILFALGVQRRLMIIALIAGTLLLATAYAFDLKMDGPQGRDGEISVRGIVARVIAPIDPDAASDMTGSDFSTFKGTVDWRTYWWDQIWKQINENDSDAAYFLGMGYAYPISDLGAYGTGGIRTPHNIFFYALGYHGWVGVVVFWLMQGLILYTLWRVYRQTGQAFGIVFVVICTSMGLFGNFFETPYGAIPYYLVVGICAAPLANRWVQSHYVPGVATPHRDLVQKKE